MTPSPYLPPVCHRTWVSHYQHSLLPSFQLHDLWKTRREHSNAWNQPSNPSLPFPAHNPSTWAHHSWGVCTGAASTPPDWNPPHTSILLPSYQDSESLRDSGHSLAFCQKQIEEQTRMKHLLEPHRVLCFDDGFCNHQGISHKHPFSLMQSWVVTLSGSEKQYKT